MKNLKNLCKPDGTRPSIFTIVGEGGLGKTTLAAMFPKPVMIRTEDGVQSIRGADVALFPLAQSSDEVFDNIAALVEEEHDFKTLIIDSITQLNTIIEAEVIASDPKHPKSLNQALGGYGAGHGAVAERHREIRQACGYLSGAKGMHVVFIAHADSEQVDLPDSEPYSRYTIRMNKRSVGHYSDNVDVVGFLKLRRFLKGDADNRKAVSDGTRIITCHPTPNHISKNRFGINEDLVFDLSGNPFTPYIGE